MLEISIERMTRGLSNRETFALVEKTASFLSEMDTVFFVRDGGGDPSDSDARAITTEEKAPRESRASIFYGLFPDDVWLNSANERRLGRDIENAGK